MSFAAASARFRRSLSTTSARRWRRSTATAFPRSALRWPTGFARSWARRAPRPAPPTAATGPNSLSPDGRYPAAGQFDQIGRRKAEDRVRGPRRGPDLTEGHQSLVDKHDRSCSVPDRRNAADRIARRLADEIGVGARDRFAGQRRDPFLVDPMRARGDDEHGAAVLRVKDERFRDLRNRAANRARRVLRDRKSVV